MSQGFTSQLPIPLPVAQGGTGVTTSTGTGNTVLSTSPTLSVPKINNIADTNGNTVLGLGAVASAVNYISASNNATGSFPYFASTGTDTNIDFGVYTKGTGKILLLSANTTQPLVIYSGTSYQHTTTFQFSNTAASRTVTFPDVTGTVNIGLSTGGIQAWVNFNGTGTVAIRASSNVTSITDNGTGDYTVNITTALTDANYSAVALCGFGVSNNYSGSNVPYVSGPVDTPTTTSYRLQTGQGAVGSQSGNIIDCTFVSVQIVR